MLTLKKGIFAEQTSYNLAQTQRKGSSPVSQSYDFLQKQPLNQNSNSLNYKTTNSFTYRALPHQTAQHSTIINRKPQHFYLKQQACV